MKILTRKQVEDFQALIKDEFGEEMTYTDAEQRALKVLDLFVLLYGNKELNDHWAREYRGVGLGPEFPGFGSHVASAR